MVHLKACMRTVCSFTLPLLLLVWLCACSRQKTISPDELQSEITKAVSLASETELLAQVARSGKATQHYVQEHAEYLQQEAGDTLKDLAKPVPSGPEQSTVLALKQSLQAVSQDLGKMKDAERDDKESAAIEQRLRTTREKLTEMKDAR